MKKKVGKRIIKIVAVGLLASAICVNMQPKSAEACSYSPWCGTPESSKSAVCSVVNGRYIGTHTIEYGNGYKESCAIIVISGSHKMVCSNCGHLYYTEDRTCSVNHNHSRCTQTQLNMCK